LPPQKISAGCGLVSSSRLNIDIILLQQSLQHGRVFKATDKGISNEFSRANPSPNIYKGATFDYVAAKMRRRP